LSYRAPRWLLPIIPAPVSPVAAGRTRTAAVLPGCGFLRFRDLRGDPTRGH